MSTTIHKKKSKERKKKHNIRTYKESERRTQKRAGGKKIPKALFINLTVRSTQDEAEV